MTNEELCQRYQDGDQGALWELWQQNEGFTRIQARKVERAQLSFGRELAAFEDLMQSAWFAVEPAAQAFDPASGWKYLTYYSKHLKTAFAAATGTRTEKQSRDPLQSARSLDAPISEGQPEGDTFGSLIQDPRQDMDRVDERLYREWERAFLRSQVDALPADQAQVLRLRYWNGATRAAAAAAMGVNDAKVRELERRGLDALRRRQEVRALRGYVDERTDFFRGGSNPVEANAIWREELTERWSGHRIE